MGIGSVLNSALAGLHVTEKGLDVVSRNIANAGTEGYTRKVLNREAVLAAGDAISVRARSVDRQLDLLLQRELRQANAAAAGAETVNDYLTRVDRLFGTPGEVNALDTVFNDFSQALQQLASAPDAGSVRQLAVGAAQTLAQQLNQTTAEVQRLRGEADRGLASAVNEVNDALQQIQRINSEIIERFGAGAPPPDLLDERDRQIDRLAVLMDVQVFEGSNGTISIFTESGISLFDGEAASLSFDPSGTVSPDTLYNSDPAQRTIGTVTIASALNGDQLDLLQPGTLRSGTIHALATVRDEILVRVQDQLDEIAAALAQTFSALDIAGTPVSAGAQTGYDLDLSGLQPGNTFDVTTIAGGATRTFTFVRVDDPSALPLSGDVTGNSNDTVVGIDFSGGLGSAVAAIAAALGSNFTVTDQGGGVLRILDDGAAGLSDVGGASASVTASGLANGDLQFQLFIDGARSPSDFTNNLDGSPQKRGFAGRIALNPAVAADPASLVVYSTTPLSGLGDPARAFFLVDRLNEAALDFSPRSGIGSNSAPFSGTIGDYLQRVIDFQAGQKANSDRELQSRNLMKDSLTTRFQEESGVNMDRELAELLVLQNAYAANARILSAMDELMDVILRI